MNKKVLIICTSLNMGGTEKQAVWLANKLSDENYKVFFVSLKDAGILSQYLNSNIITKNFKLADAKNTITKVFHFIIGLLQLIKLVNKYKITKTITFLFHSNLVGKFLKIFSIYDNSHIVAFRSDRLSKRDSKVNRLRTFLFKNFILDKKTTVVYNSNSGFKKLNLKSVNQKIIYNHPLNKSQSKNYHANKFIYIGRLDELKNVQNIVLGFKNIKESNVSLDIYGKGPDLPYIQKMIDEHSLEKTITLKGINPSISDNLSKFDALILGSTHEAFPNVLIEAFNAGVIPISTNVGDASWLIGKNRGLLIQGFTSDKISKSILEFLDLNIELRKLHIANGKKFLEENLSETKTFKQWLELI